jgi:hypothetical protein
LHSLQKLGTFEIKSLISIGIPDYKRWKILAFLADQGYQRDVLTATVAAIGNKTMGRILDALIRQREHETSVTLLSLMGELEMDDFADLEGRASILLFLVAVGYSPDRLEKITQKLGEEELRLVFNKSKDLQECSANELIVLASCARIHGSTLVKGAHSIMFTAAQRGDIATLKFFFELCNVSTEVVNEKFHQAALSHAAENGRVAAVKYLLGIRASVKARDKDGRTALWWAAREGKIEVVRELILSGNLIIATKT